MQIQFFACPYFQVDSSSAPQLCSLPGQLGCQLRCRSKGIRCEHLKTCSQEGHRLVPGTGNPGHWACTQFPGMGSQPGPKSHCRGQPVPGLHHQFLGWKVPPYITFPGASSYLPLCCPRSSHTDGTCAAFSAGFLPGLL